MAEVVTIYYATDTLLAGSSCFYDYESGGLEITLPTEILAQDEAHFLRQTEPVSVVAISDSAVPMLLAVCI